MIQPKGGKAKAIPQYSFDIENDLKDLSKRAAIYEQLESRIQQLKLLLRKGEDKTFFDQTQKLMHGYLARQRVLNRAERKF